MYFILWFRIYLRKARRINPFHKQFVLVTEIRFVKHMYNVLLSDVTDDSAFSLNRGF